MEESRPVVTLSAAISVDGKIATVRGESALSSDSDRQRVHEIRASADAILIGKNTQEMDDPLLTVRLAKGSSPTRVILDSAGTISSSSKIIQTCGAVPTIIAVSERISEENAARLARFDLEVLRCGESKVDIKKLLGILHRRGIRSVLAEGGGKVNWHLARHGLIDRVIVAVTPYILGGEDAASLVRGAGFARISDAARLKLRRHAVLQDEVVLEYDVVPRARN